MPIHNNDVAEIFNKNADFLDIKGENPFRIRAFRNAARAIGGLSSSVADLVEQGRDLSEIPGIGKDLAEKIKEIVETRTLPLLEKLERELPPELSILKTAKEIGLKLVISTDAHRLDDLKFMRYGIGQARRGWLEAEDVLNTRIWKELRKLLKRK
jgi:DNA polymerase (family 10)